MCQVIRGSRPGGRTSTHACVRSLPSDAALPSKHRAAAQPLPARGPPTRQVPSHAVPHEHHLVQPLLPPPRIQGRHEKRLGLRGAARPERRPPCAPEGRQVQAAIGCQHAPRTLPRRPSGGQLASLRIVSAWSRSLALVTAAGGCAARPGAAPQPTPTHPTALCPACPQQRGGSWS